jgi:hypothetical protein
MAYLTGRAVRPMIDIIEHAHGIRHMAYTGNDFTQEHQFIVEVANPPSLFRYIAYAYM